MLNYVLHMTHAQRKRGSQTKICPTYIEVRHRRVQIAHSYEDVLQRYLKNSAKSY